MSVSWGTSWGTSWASSWGATTAVAVEDQASNWQANWWKNKVGRTQAEEDLERAKLGIIAFPDVEVYDTIEEAPEIDKLYLKGLNDGNEIKAKSRRKRAITLLLLH